MKLTTSDVRRIAKLSNLDLTKTEIKEFQTELSQIINYIKQLDQVDTKDTEPTAQTTGLQNITRPDDINPLLILSPKEALLNSEKSENNYFKVPIILKKDK